MLDAVSECEVHRHQRRPELFEDFGRGQCFHVIDHPQIHGLQRAKLSLDEVEPSSCRRGGCANGALVRLRTSARHHDVQAVINGTAGRLRPSDRCGLEAFRARHAPQGGRLDVRMVTIRRLRIVIVRIVGAIHPRGRVEPVVAEDAVLHRAGPGDQRGVRRSGQRGKHAECPRAERSVAHQAAEMRNSQMIPIGVSEIVAAHAVDGHQDDVPLGRGRRLGPECDRERDEPGRGQAGRKLHDARHTNMNDCFRRGTCIRSHPRRVIDRTQPHVLNVVGAPS